MYFYHFSVLVVEMPEICISEVFGSNIPGVVILVKEFLISCFLI